MVSPLILNTARLLSVFTVGVATGILALLAYYPYTAIRMGHIFEPSLYMASFLILLLPALWLGSLFAAIFYQVTRRVDLSFVLVAACLLLSLSKYVSENFILRWANPIIPVFSDDFSNTLPLRMALYNRLFWLMVTGGLWLLSVLFIRRYGRGLWGSMVGNGSKIYIPLLALLLLTGGVNAYAYQPYVNHAPLEADNARIEYNEKFGLVSTDVVATPNIAKGTQHGTATYQILNDNTEPVEQRVSINTGYRIHRMTVNGQSIPFTDLNNDHVFSKNITFVLPPVKKLEVVMEYSGFPQLWSLSQASMNGDEVSRRYVYLQGPAFAPVMEMGGSQEVENTFSAEVTLPTNMTPVVIGADTKLLHSHTDGTQTWRAEGIFSRSINLFAADYVLQQVKTSSMAADFYYSRKHEQIMETVNIRQTLADVFDYCVGQYGPLSFRGDKLKLVQTTAYMFGGFAAKDTSVISETSFSEDGLSDLKRGASGSEVMAHEIIHQWWGLGKMFDDDGVEWSSEGFTVYTTYRMMKEKHGAAYAKEHYVDVWQKAVDEQNRNFYNRHPEYRDSLPAKYSEVIQQKANGVNLYRRMPLKLLKAAELIGGEDKLDKIMSNLFQTEETENPPYLGYNDFLKACGLTKEALELD
jgi:hypothetical protein